MSSSCVAKHRFASVSILQKKGCSETPKGPSFTFFGTMRLTGDQKNRIFFQFVPHAGTAEEVA